VIRARSLPSRWLAGLSVAALAVSVLGALPPASAAASAARVNAQAAAGVIPAPVARGRLRITGLLRDGGTVTARGATFGPPPLPSGDVLLSFGVKYTWRRCPAQGSGKCVLAADSVATPFAARSYVVGHADVGSRLRVTVTAIAVVQTDRHPFTFRVIRASSTATTRGVAGAFPVFGRPWAALINGTPEARTASVEEWFQVSAPHWSTAGGRPVQWFRVDKSKWQRLHASRVFYTGKLKPGAHSVAVRTANRYGLTTIHFRWRVVPLPAPVACQPAPGRRCWYPPHLASNGKPMRWDWQIGRTDPQQRTGRRAVDIYDIDGFLTTRAQVSAIHSRWQASTLAHPKAVCYLDLAWEDYRPDGSPGQVFPAAALGHVYFGFPQERWVDLRQLNALKPMLRERLSRCASKGFDAVELDDIDSFDPPSTTGFRLTPGDAQNFLAWAFNEIHRLGMTGLWKNSPLLAWWGRQYSDGAVVEECYTFGGCFSAAAKGTKADGITCTGLKGPQPCGWDAFTADRTAAQPTGKWVGEAEYGADGFVCNPGSHCHGKHTYAAFCRAVYGTPNGFSAVKFDVDLDGHVFYPCPRGV